MDMAMLPINLSDFLLRGAQSRSTASACGPGSSRGL